MKPHLLSVVLLLLAVTCNSQGNDTLPAVVNSGPDSALSVRLSPVKPPAYYIEQGVKYFRTMESSVPCKVRPAYSDKVIRWEWHPWLLLTGYGRSSLVNSDVMLKLYSTKYDTIDCKAFDKEPFCRCHVIFNYSGKRVPIYEEFTFNNAGQITFIEAWSDYPSLIPMNIKDYWAEGSEVKRLSTRVPGLGNAAGRINIKACWMVNAAKTDTDLADMIYRIKHPVTTYCKEFFKQRKEMAKAVYPPENDKYPYHP